MEKNKNRKIEILKGGKDIKSKSAPKISLK